LKLLAYSPDSSDSTYWGNLLTCRSAGGWSDIEQEIDVACRDGCDLRRVNEPGYSGRAS
jgi:hypothetical protein